MGQIMKAEFQNDIGIFLNVLDNKSCENLINLYDIAEDNITHNFEHMRQDDTKQYLFTTTTNKDLKLLRKQLALCLNYYASKYRTLHRYGLISDKCKIQKTNLYGGFHAWHHEHGPTNNEGGKRVLVWMIYLNSLPKDDGTTDFLFQNMSVQPEQGKLLIWPAYFTHVHRGNPPRQQIKYIATGWYEHVDLQHPLNQLKYIDFDANKNFFN